MEGSAKVGFWKVWPSPWPCGLLVLGPVVCGPVVSGPLVPRSSGILVLWSRGSLVPWSSGPVVLWSPGFVLLPKETMQVVLAKNLQQNESRSHLTPHNTSKTLHRKSKSPSSFMQNPEPSNQIPDGLGADTALPIAIPLLPNITCCTRKRSKSSCPAEEDP